VEYYSFLLYYYFWTSDTQGDAEKEGDDKDDKAEN